MKYSVLHLKHICSILLKLSPEMITDSGSTICSLGNIELNFLLKEHFQHDLLTPF